MERKAAKSVMNLLHLRYFVELAQQEHYTRAAEKLCITQPTLSHAMNQLEQELGIPLFEKQGRNVHLTYYGQQFLGYTRQALSSLDQGVEILQRVGRGEGTIRLGFLRTLGVDFIPRLASDFLKENPDKTIHFVFHSGVTGQLLRELSERKYDLIFASQPSDDMGFTSVPVNRQDLVLIVPKNHPLAAKHAIDLAETLPYPQVCFSEGSGLRDVINQLYAQIGEQPPIACETEEDQVVAGLVAQGFGIAIVPYMDMLLRLDVKILQIANPSWERNFYMIYNDRIFQPPVVQAFRQFVQNRTLL